MKRENLFHCSLQIETVYLFIYPLTNFDKPKSGFYAYMYFFFASEAKSSKSGN